MTLNETGLDREVLLDELLLLLPVLGRGISRPWPGKMEELERITGFGDGCRHIPATGPGSISPGHVQVMISLAKGPRPVGKIADDIGVSSPAVTQMVDRLSEYGMVQRRHSDEDRRVVLVDFVPGMREFADEVMSGYRDRLEGVMRSLTDTEMIAFLKGLRLMTESLGGHNAEIPRSSIRDGRDNG